MRTRTFGTALSLVAALAAANASSAQEAPAPEADAQARATLLRMATFLASTPRLTVALQTAYDVVQPDGQKVEFGDSRKLALRRPDGFRIDAEARDGARRGLLIDGRAITTFDLNENVYASVPKQGTVDEALDYAVDELGLRIPLKELFASDLPETVTRASSVRLVANERVGSVPCEHLAVRADEVDYEVWVATGERPLLQRIVVTYRFAEGQPQFAANFASWNMSPDLPDALFAHEPAEGAERIRVAPASEGAQR